MKEPSFRTSPGDFERALWRSAEIDEPPPNALMDAATALGLDAEILAAGIAKSAGVFGLKSVLSVLSVAMGIAGAGIGIYALFASDAKPVAPTRAPALSRASVDNEAVNAAEPEPASPSLSPSSPARANPLPNRSRPLEPHAPSETVVPEVVELEPSVPDAPTAPDAPSSEPPGNSSITEELRVMDRAREMLREGQGRKALNEIAAYRSRWPNGAFATEAAVLRIEALVKIGSRDTARREARVFVAKEPTGRYAARLRALFEPSELE